MDLSVPVAILATGATAAYVPFRQWQRLRDVQNRYVNKPDVDDITWRMHLAEIEEAATALEFQPAALQNLHHHFRQVNVRQLRRALRHTRALAAAMGRTDDVWEDTDQVVIDDYFLAGDAAGHKTPIPTGEKITAQALSTSHSLTLAFLADSCPAAEAAALAVMTRPEIGRKDFEILTTAWLAAELPLPGGDLLHDVTATIEVETDGRWAVHGGPIISPATGSATLEHTAAAFGAFMAAQLTDPTVRCRATVTDGTNTVVAEFAGAHS